MSEDRPTTPAAGDVWRVLGLSVLVTALLYGTSLGFGWRWDDHSLIAGAAPGRTLGQLWTSDFWAFASTPEDSGMYRPLLATTYWLEARIAGGPDPVLSRAVNLGLLPASAVAGWWLARSWGRPMSWWAAPLWLAHPILVQSVGYAAGRSDVLCLVLVLAALAPVGRIAVDDGRRFPVAPALVGAAVLALAAMLVKESALTAVGLGLCLASVAPSVDRRRLGMGAGAIAAGVASAVALRLVCLPAAGAGESLTLGGAEPFRRLVWYVQALVVPRVHVPFYAGTPLDPVALIVFGLGLAGLGLLVARTPRLGLAVLGWWLLGTALVSEWIVLGARLSESLLVIPWAGLWVLLAPELDRVPSKWRWVAPALAACVGLVSFVGVQRWSTRVGLWASAVEDAPEVSYFRRNLVDAYLAIDDLEAAGVAVEELRGMEDALPGDRSGALYNYGNALRRAGRAQEAREALERAAQLDPRLCQAGVNAALISIALGDVPRAIRVVKAVELDDGTPPECARVAAEMIAFYSQPQPYSK